MITTGSSLSVCLLVPVAYLVDLAIGDPPRATHPVILMGWFISRLERYLYGRTRPGAGRKAAGMLVAALVPATAYFISFAVLRLAAMVSPWLRGLLEVWLIATAIAGTGLAGAARSIQRALGRGSLSEARRLAGEIVGRDTDGLPPAEVARATVESVAENTVDGVTAPIFFALLGGAPLALAYRAVNTLDSMLGHKNERYLDFGWASARLDDLANFLPARLTGLVLPITARLAGLDPLRTARTILADAAKHPSPNSGISEAGFAGALGVTLGGLNRYCNRASFRPLLGAGRRAPAAADIGAAVRLLRLTAVVFLILFTGLAWLTRLANLGV